MGCAASGSSRKKGGVRLMATKLAFTKSQLNNLNAYFRKLVEEAQNGECLTSSAMNLARRRRRSAETAISGAGADADARTRFFLGRR